MAFDGGFLYKTVGELKSAIDCHIDKIYQPSKDELVFLLRKKGFVKRLLITVRSGSARLHFTENKYENPAVPPNFCMFLRKHLSSARLIDISQTGLERVVELHFSATNELGDTVFLKLICEMIGNQANVILVKEDGKILDALRHSDVETAKRLILPGAVYEYPPSQQKLNPLECDFKKVAKRVLESGQEISKELLSLFDGFSPLVCREAEYLLAKQGLNEDNFQKILSDFILKLKEDKKLYLISGLDTHPLDFCYIPISQYGNGHSVTEFESCSELLDAFYTAKDNSLRIGASARDIIKLVNNLKGRTEKRLSLRLQEIKKCENRENLRIYGELLKANLHSIPQGASLAEAVNYYDEHLKSVKIPLNPAISPAKNAEKYFKDYKKTYSAEQTLTLLTEEDRKELLYFDTVLDSISRCETLSSLQEIRAELTQAGYIKSFAQPRKTKPTEQIFKEYASQEGYKIIVGRNNLQNDYITTRLASKGDMWFHTKNIAGSHVVVFCGSNELSDDTIKKAALLAAKNSKAANSSQVPVDYTPIKFVKKPSGAKPGMVIYTTNKTIFVNPLEN